MSYDCPKNELPGDTVGAGLWRVHYPYILEHWPAVGFFEIISENVLEAPPAAAPPACQAGLRFVGGHRRRLAQGAS